MDKQYSDEMQMLVSGISRGIRTPLNTLTGLIELGKKNVSDAAVMTDVLSKMENVSRQLLRVAGEVIETIRVENDLLSFEETPLDMADLLQASVDKAVRENPGKKLELIWYPQNLRNRVVLGDRQILVRIIDQILNFAFVREASVISVQLEEGNSGMRDYALFLVRVYDNGRSPLDTAADSSRNTYREDSASLGMSLARSLAEKLDGSLRIHPGEAQNRVTLEVVLRQTKEKPVKAEEAPKKVKTAAAEVSLKGRRVLVVEDNELNREILADLLQSEGLLVEEAEDGQAAVEMVEANENGWYDFVLMDIQMPRMDGYEATRQIRRLPQGGQILPIIAMTADAFEEDRKKALDAGMDEHLAKPLELAQLTEVLKKYSGTEAADEH